MSSRSMLDHPSVYVFGVWEVCWIILAYMSTSLGSMLEHPSVYVVWDMLDHPSEFLKLRMFTSKSSVYVHLGSIIRTQFGKIPCLCLE
ncbi:hypothetical protein CEXT_675461 [Caerostris extrusa]|uniref:Uncharacterized protein n=1 Tax=Caerostris extrusa TaxID=172846 RepID=A0AAV4XDX8_CAEEX|nr:hypothetical protein CEXT_675461 [Caerostris extrusa]